MCACALYCMMLYALAVCALMCPRMFKAGWVFVCDELRDVVWLVFFVIVCVCP